MKQERRGRPKDPNRIVTPAQLEREQIKKAKRAQTKEYRKLQLYYYFTVGREYLNSRILANNERVKILKQLEILDKLNIPLLLGEEKILSPGNLTDWFDNLYQYRFELRRLGIIISSKTRLAGAAQRVVRLFGLDIVYLDRRLENGRSICRYRGANSHSDADKNILNGWLERDRQAVTVERTDGD